MNLRDADPDMAAFIDSLRDAFGAEPINQAMRDGVRGLPDRFHYTGPAGEVGTPFRPLDPAKVIDAGQMVLESLRVDPGKGKGK